MSKKTYLFLTHRTYDNGKIKSAGIDQIMEYLLERDNTIYLIEHPIESDFAWSTLKKLGGQLLKKIKVHPSKAPWRFFGEILIGFVWSKKLTKKEKINIIFAADALNVLSVLPLRIFNKKLRVYFFSADYSPKRFGNPLLDLVYRKLYNLALKKSDKTFVVSQRIHDKLSQKYPGKVVFLPNSPAFESIPKVQPEKKDRYSLVFCAGRLTERVNLNEIFESLKILKKEFPKTTLHLIGKDNEQVQKLIKKYELEKNIKIYDFLTHTETLKVISKSYIGISWYSPEVSHIYWGDSLKIREYAASGLPTVTDGITSTADEMLKREAGFIIKTPAEMAERIKILIKDKKIYEKTRKNALRWAKKMDKGNILEKIFKNV